MEIPGITSKETIIALIKAYVIGGLPPPTINLPNGYRSNDEDWGDSEARLEMIARFNCTEPDVIRSK